MLTAALGLLGGAIYGCGAPPPGSEPGEGEPEPAPSNVAPEAPLTAEQHEDEFQRKVAATLSPEEMVAIESVLHANSVDMSEVSFAGRMVLFGDAYVDADTLLPAAGAVEKGRTYGGLNTDLLTDGVAIGPTQYSRREGDSNGDGAPDQFYAFHRPDTSLMVIVVPNAAAASFLIQPFKDAVANIKNAADTCLTSNSIRVYTQSEYDAEPLVFKQVFKEIFVRYDSLAQACPGQPSDTAGCAVSPREVTENFGIGNQTRMVPGTRIGINSGLVNTSTYDNEKLVGLLMHEFLHALGLQHPTASLGSLAVPNTDCRVGVSTIMQGNGSVSTLQRDDASTIDTLYSPAPGGVDTCAYTRSFKILGPARTNAQCETCDVACTKISSSNIAGMCCQCQGVYKHWVKTTFSATTYLCQ